VSADATSGGGVSSVGPGVGVAAALAVGPAAVADGPAVTAAPGDPLATAGRETSGPACQMTSSASATTVTPSTVMAPRRDDLEPRGIERTKHPPVPVGSGGPQHSVAIRGGNWTHGAR
jgi:hypothetical protein